MQALKDERTEHINRIKGLLASQGLAAPEVNKHFAGWLGKARLWDGTPMPHELQRRLLRELERWQLLDRQIKELEDERRQRIRRDDTPHVDQVRALLDLWGIGQLQSFTIEAWISRASTRAASFDAGGGGFSWQSARVVSE